MPGRTEVFGAFAFVPEPLKVGAVRACILNQLKNVARYSRSRLEDVVGTWSHPVEFTKPIIRYAGGDAYVSITTDDDVFQYLDEGTIIRWAHMTPDFLPKTAPRRFKSGGGRGGLARVGAPPRPGIKAREWTLVLSEEIEILLENYINDCIDSFFP